MPKQQHHDHYMMPHALPHRKEYLGKDITPAGSTAWNSNANDKDSDQSALRSSKEEQVKFCVLLDFLKVGIIDYLLLASKKTRVAQAQLLLFSETNP